MSSKQWKCKTEKNATFARNREKRSILNYILKRTGLSSAILYVIRREQQVEFELLPSTCSGRIKGHTSPCLLSLSHVSQVQSETKNFQVLSAYGLFAKLSGTSLPSFSDFCLISSTERCKVAGLASLSKKGSIISKLTSKLSSERWLMRSSTC
jgi:hypothetical protein